MRRLLKISEREGNNMRYSYAVRNIIVLMALAVPIFKGDITFSIFLLALVFLCYKRLMLANSANEPIVVCMNSALCARFLPLIAEKAARKLLWLFKHNL